MLESVQTDDFSRTFFVVNKWSVFLDKMSRHSQVVEGFRFAELMITALLFVEGVLLASSVGDLQLTRVVCSHVWSNWLGGAKSNFWGDSTFPEKDGVAPLGMEGVIVPGVPKYLRVLFKSG